MKRHRPLLNIWRAACVIAIACSTAAVWSAPSWTAAGSLAATACIVIVGAVCVILGETA